MFTVYRVKGATKPDTIIFWKIDNSYLDLSSGFTFTVECANTDGTAAFTDKTTGVTGGVGSKTVASATIVWTTSDLGGLSAGRYKLEVTATSGTSVYKEQGQVVIVDEVT